MGEEERKQMYLELESTVKELNEMLWKIGKIRNDLSNLAMFLMEKPAEKIVVEQYPCIKDFVNLEEIARLTEKAGVLKARRMDLEEKLGFQLTRAKQKT